MVTILEALFNTMCDVRRSGWRGGVRGRMPSCGGVGAQGGYLRAVHNKKIYLQNFVKNLLWKMSEKLNNINNDQVTVKINYQK